MTAQLGRQDTWMSGRLTFFLGPRTVLIVWQLDERRNERVSIRYLLLLVVALLVQSSTVQQTTTDDWITAAAAGGYGGGSPKEER